jgi:hypothetical protein
VHFFEFNLMLNRWRLLKVSSKSEIRLQLYWDFIMMLSTYNLRLRPIWSLKQNWIHHWYVAPAFFSWWYTLFAPLVEGAGKVSRSAATTTTFRMTLAKAGLGTPSWLMVVTTSLARAWALVWSIVTARSISSADLWWCSSVRSASIVA